jgi:TRAP-type mannitol/chloroaromatic compound transport system substrate-binding protein
MKKTHVITIIAATITALVMFASTAFAQKVYKWRMVSVWPSYTAFSQVEKRLVKNIYELSGGRMQITIYSAGELVPTSAVFDTVAKGSVEMGIDYPGYWQGKNTVFDILGTIPMAASQHDIINWYMHRGGRELFNEMYGKYNLIYYMHSVASAGSGLRTRTPIRTLADLKGKKIRVSGRAAGYVMTKVGATPVMTDPAQMAQALGSGQIDAASFNSPLVDLSLGLAEVTKYNIGPGWNIPSGVGGLMINKDVWDTLPPDLKKIIEVATMDSITYFSSLSECDNGEALKKFQEKGTVVTKFSDKELDQIEAWVWEFIEDEAKKNPDFEKVATSIFQYMKDFSVTREYQQPYAQGRNPTRYPRLPKLK